MTLTLPTGLKEANTSLDKTTLLIFGPDKCGKTSFITQFPNHFMLECNPGNANHLKRSSVDVSSWEEATGYLELLEKNPLYSKVIIIDEVNRLYNYCYRYVRKQLRLAETEKDDFDVWRTVRNLFSATLDGIKTLNRAVILTANEEVVTVSMGLKDVSMLDINLNNQGRDVLHGFALMRARMAYSDTGNGKRVLEIDGVRNVNVGHGFSDHFLYGGMRLKEIDLGASPQEAYENFIKAYNNELPGPVIQLAKKTGPTLTLKK